MRRLSLHHSSVVDRKTPLLLSVWKSDEKLLIFASIISPSEIILFEK